MPNPALPRQPEQLADAFVSAFNSGDLDTVIAFYTSDSVLNFGGGQIFTTLANIRAALANFLAPKLPMQIKQRFVVSSGDTALVSFDWLIEGAAPDGSAVRLEGTTSDVIRRDADGFWRHLLDHPFGSATQPA